MVAQLLNMVDGDLLTAAQVADTLGLPRDIVLDAARPFEAGAWYDGNRRIPYFTIESALAMREYLVTVAA